MEWDHKGIVFRITAEPLGRFCLVSASVPPEGRFVRIRPFSALGRSEEQALEMLKEQIRAEYRKVPAAAEQD